MNRFVETREGGGLSNSLSPSDERVLARVSRSPAGASAAAIAKASLGPRARRHSFESLNMIGLSIAARLCGQQVIVATKTNQFIVNPQRTA